MVKVVIVDDDNLTRAGLVKNIDWEDLNAEVCGVARDGVEGLELIQKINPDILLTDVRMPRMNGTDLAVKTREGFPDCHIIFLSGYSDKEYLKTAIKIRAIDYIEKPIDVDEITEVVRKTIAIIKNNSLQADANRHFSKTVEDIIGFIDENYHSEISIEYIAENVYLSPNYMSGLFKKETGKTINQYITEIRINVAKKMLRETKFKVNEISREVGYTDQRYFSKVFKKLQGMNPKEYREKLP